MVEVRAQSDSATSKWENHLLHCAQGNRHVRTGKEPTEQKWSSPSLGNVNSSYTVLMIIVFLGK